MKTKALLILGALLQAPLWSESTLVHFPKGTYSIRELIDSIQQETHLNIDLPFADSQNDKKSLPPEMELDESLVWILRYYERSNGLALYIVRSGEQIQFQKSFGGHEAEVKKLFNKKIKLVGQQWSIHQALQSAADQVGMPLDCPAEPKVVVPADYNYECSLGEWVGEVRQYWMNQHSRYLSYRFGDRGLSFRDAGPAPKKELQIEILGKFLSVESSMEEPKASTVTEVKPAPSEAVVESDDGKPKPNPTTQSDKETSDSSPKHTSVVSTPWRTHRRSSEEESPMSESLFQNETSQNGSTQSDLLVLKDTSAPKTLLPEVAPTDLAPIDRWVEQPKSQSPSLHPADQLRVLAKNGPLVFLNAEARRQLLTELIRPRPLAEDVTDILELIKKIAQPTKGLDSWLDQFAQVDLKGMDTYERKKILRNIEENWLEELLVHEAQKPILLPADRGWHGDYGLECGGGANPQAVGDHPLRSSGASSMWLSQQLDLDYRVNPVGPWSYNYGLQFNHVFSTGSSQDDGSWSGLGCNFKSTREINQQGLAAISPYVVFNRADSFLVDHGQLRQNLYLAGISFNWAELHLSGAFEKCVGTTDVFIDKVQPLGHTNRHFVDGRHLSQSAWGLRHTQNWLKANAEGQEGPGLELAIVERNGDHPAATGLELGTGVLWQYQRQHWGYQSGLSLNYWGRDEAVTSWVLHGRLEGQLFPKGLNYAELSFENSSSSDPIMDYTSTRLALGWGIKW